MIIALLFLILFAILLPGLMRFLFAMLGLFIIALFMIAAAHAEPARPGDVIIHDRTNYRNCTDSTLTKVVAARPPYYILLFCYSYNPRNDPRILPQCSSLAHISYCTMEDCENSTLKGSRAPWRGEGQGVACATTDGAGSYALEIKGVAQDGTRQSDERAGQATDDTDECDPAFVTVNAILVEATMKCGVNYMDTKVGNDVNALAHACDVKLGTSKIHSLMHTAIRGWENNYKSDKKEACENTDKAFRAIEAASAPKP